ncbi:MAG: 30S ribosomal protein S18 [Myxococcales bacterium]|nr:30S ribosomal protein S18 [Myxococcales bacterium]
MKDKDRGSVPPPPGGEAAGAFRRARRRGCTYCSDEALKIDYKDPQALRYFVTERGKIVPRRISGACAKHQREIQVAVKRARNIALLPFTSN